MSEIRVKVAAGIVTMYVQIRTGDVFLEVTFTSDEAQDLAGKLAKAATASRLVPRETGLVH